MEQQVLVSLLCCLSNFFFHVSWHIACTLTLCIDFLARRFNLPPPPVSHFHMRFRGVSVPGFEDGNFVGPTILAGNMGPGNPAYDEEVFAPVLCCVGVDTLEEAIDFVNACKYGNGSAIFTQSGIAAREFQRKINAGQVNLLQHAVCYP